jgi:hypothetical protein
VKLTDEEKRNLCMQIEEEIIKCEDLGVDYRVIAENVVSIVVGERVNYFVESDADTLTDNIMDEVFGSLIDDPFHEIVKPQINQVIRKFFGL